MALRMLALCWLAMTSLIDAQSILLALPSAGPVAPAGDLNGDGVPDVIAGHGLWSGLDGSSLGSLPPVRALGVGDVDGGGRSDLLLWNPGNPQLQLVSRESGAVLWQQQGFPPLSNGPHDALVFVPDADGDGIDDFAVLRADRLTLHSGASGNPVWINVLASPAGRLTVLGDVDGDGVVDLGLLRGNPRGAWSGATGALIASGDPGLPCGDLDGDGFADTLLMTNGTGGFQRTLLLGPTLSSAGPPEPSRWIALTLPLGDADGDGRGEVLLFSDRSTGGFPPYTPDFSSGVLTLCEGVALEALSAFDPESFGLSQVGGSATLLGDLDGDGLDDFALGPHPVAAPTAPALLVRTRYPLSRVERPGANCTPNAFVSTIALEEGVPVLGATNRLFGATTSGHVSGSLLVSPVPTQPVLLPGGCAPLIDLGSAVELGPLSFQGLIPHWDYTIVLPLDPSLRGVRVAVQAIFPSSFFAAGLGFSEPLYLTLDGWF